MKPSLEYRTLVCVSNHCLSSFPHRSVETFADDYEFSAVDLLSGAIHHHMTFFTDALSQEEKRAWMASFLCLADAEKQVRVSR